jgi:hypothetical protein
VKTTQAVRSLSIGKDRLPKQKGFRTVISLPIFSAAIAALTLAAAVISAEPRRAVRESGRDIPVAYDVDVVVLGGSTGAVSAAVAAAEAGASVFWPHRIPTWATT